MIVVRDVFQAKYGKGDELIQLIKEGASFIPIWARNGRLLADLSGPFFTIVTEAEFDNLSAWEADSRREFSDPRFAEWFARMMPLVESGRREFYHVVE